MKLTEPARGAQHEASSGESSVAGAVQKLDTPFALLELDGTILRANEALTQWAGRGAALTTIRDVSPVFADVDLSAALSDVDRFVVAADAFGDRGRPIPVEYVVRRVQAEGLTRLWLEGRDLSRVQQKEAMLRSFSQLIETNNRLLRQQKRSLTDLLDKMRQAVFAIGAELTVVPPVSRYTREIFGRDLEGKGILDTVFADVDKASGAFDDVRTTLNLALGADKLQWALAVDGLPDRITYTRPSPDGTPASSRALKLSYSPMWEDAVVEKILFVVEDVTELERLASDVAQEREANAQSLSHLEELSRHGRDTIQELFASSAAALSRARRCAARLEREPEGVNELLRLVHTIKGNARTLGLGGITASAHSAEAAIAAVRAAEPCDAASQPELGTRVVAALAELQGVCAGYNRLAVRAFGVDDELGRAAASELHEQMQTLDASLFALERAILPRAVKRAVDSALASARRIAELSCALADTSLAAAVDALVAEVSREASPSPESVALAVRSFERLVALADASVRRFSLRADVGFERPAWLPIIVTLARIEHHVRSGTIAEVGARALSLAAHSGSVERVHIAWIAHRFEALAAAQPAPPDREASLRALLDAAWREVALFTLVEARTLPVALREHAVDLVGAFAKCDGGGDAKPRIAAHHDLCLGAALERLHVDGRAASSVIDAIARALDLDVDELLAIFAAGAPVASSRRDAELEVEFEPADAGRRDGRVRLARAALVRGRGVTPCYLRWSALTGLCATTTSAEGGTHEELPQMVPVIARNFAGMQRLYVALSHGRARTEDVLVAIERLFEVPAVTQLARLKATVRELAPSLGKRAELVLEGGATPVNRDTLLVLRDALMHVVRNALDHGIETEHQRAAHGKSPTGHIVVRLERRGADLCVEASDDGAGIDVDAVVERAVALGVVASEQALAMTPDERLALSLLPGLTTAAQVTTISGRGVGLDVVASAVQELGGTVRVTSERGAGTRILISVPASRMRRHAKSTPPSA